jgi:DNA-binding transcriptional ArsR family regulator
MSTHLSVAEIFRKLEERLRLHEERAAFHAQQEIHHREQSAFHVAELQKVRENFEAFKATALAAADLAQESGALASPEPVEEADDLHDLIGRRIMVSKLVSRVVDRMGEGEAFGAARVAAEVNRRYREHLRRAVSARAVSVTLRRLRDAGEIRAVREGKASQESVYVRGGEPGNSLS